MDELCDDIIHLLFENYTASPHILIVDRFINNSYKENIMIDECYFCYNNSKLWAYYKNYLCINASSTVLYRKLNYKTAIAIVTQDGWCLRYIPENLKTYELCLAAVTNCETAVFHVPRHMCEYKMVVDTESFYTFELTLKSYMNIENIENNK